MRVLQVVLLVDALWEVLDALLEILAEVRVRSIKIYEFLTLEDYFPLQFEVLLEEQVHASERLANLFEYVELRRLLLVV